MEYKDHEGNIIFSYTFQDKILEKLYTTKSGNNFIKIITLPFISKTIGKIAKSKLSRFLINYFIKINKIDMSQYIEKDFKSFNDFFIRKIEKNARPININNDDLISPCDGKLTVVKINENSKFKIKKLEYNLHSLLRDRKLAKRFENGLCLIFRLSVEDYHRYCYIDNVTKTNNRKIKGVYHTVNPIIYDYQDIFKENSREYTLMKTENFGNVIQVEIGALFVGTINNYHERGIFSKGDEKGYFDFGGSTIVLLFEENKVKVDKYLLDNTKDNFETIVKMGEKIGAKI